MLTRKSKYGLKALLVLAEDADRGPVLISELAERQQLPKKFLEAILLELKRAGLLHSKKGKGGGYVLGRKPTEITVGQVIRALEGPINIVSCLEDSECPQMEKCNLRRPVHKIQAAISQVLDTMSLAELASADVPELLSIKG